MKIYFENSYASCMKTEAVFLAYKKVKSVANLRRRVRRNVRITF